MAETLHVMVAIGPIREYRAIRRYDPDVFEHLDAGDWEAARALLLTRCRCGHLRADHGGATGVLAGFGGSACDNCWTCGTFTPDGT